MAMAHLVMYWTGKLPMRATSISSGHMEGVSRWKNRRKAPTDKMTARAEFWSGMGSGRIRQKSALGAVVFNLLESFLPHQFPHLGKRRIDSGSVGAPGLGQVRAAATRTAHQGGNVLDKALGSEPSV
jgi:hypothetical protein